ncbi:MAG TPA: aldo/keto reductase [Ilumatobacteraceae bacterium]|jgi:aryl-alcohol dehydrogenase-like predicted oxidoreductase
MQYRQLGNTGIEVSTLGLGTMMFGRWGNPDEAECRRMVDRALEAGITLFDTADIYDFGTSEEYLGRALEGRRDRVVLATKVGNAMSEDPQERGLSRRWIIQSCESSLRRLRTDHLDLYQMHRPDPHTPIDESLQAFEELVQAGKVRAIGTSTFSVAELEEARTRAESLGVTVPRSEQPPYSALVRNAENEVLPWCRRHDVGVVVWAPLNGGWLTGKYQNDDAVDTSARAAREPEHFDHRDAAMRQTKRALVAELANIATDHGLTLIDLALGFVLANPAVTSALIGPRRPEQLDSLLVAADVALPPNVLTAIDRVVAPGRTVNPVDDG